MSSISVSGDDRIGLVYLEIEQQNSPTQKQKMKRASGTSGTITKKSKRQLQKGQKTRTFVTIGVPKEEEKESGTKGVLEKNNG